MPESTTNIFVAALMGIIGGLISTPLNAICAWYLKQEEISYQHRLNLLLKKRELLWQHHLERSSVGMLADDISFISAKIRILEGKLQNIEGNDIAHLQKKMYDVNENLRQFGIAMNSINRKVYEIEHKVEGKG